MIVCSTVARRVEVPASGSNENAIVPNGQVVALSNAGDAIIDVEAAVSAIAVDGIVADASAVVMAAMSDRKLLLESLLLLLLMFPSCSSCSFSPSQPPLPLSTAFLQHFGIKEPNSQFPSKLTLLAYFDMIITFLWRTLK